MKKLKNLGEYYFIKSSSDYEYRWHVYKIQNFQPKFVCRLDDFKDALIKASEERLIEFFINSKIQQLRILPARVFGEYGEFFFQETIPEFYEKYKLLITR